MPASKSVARWIEVVYNRRRRHSALGMVSPVSLEYHVPFPKATTKKERLPHDSVVPLRVHNIRTTPLSTLQLG